MGGSVKDINNQLQKQGNNKPAATENKTYNTMEKFIEQNLQKIGQALPKMITAERFTRIILTQIRFNAKLAQCSAESLVGAMLTCAQLGLEPGPTQQAYLIPYWNTKKGCYEAQFQLGYTGLLELARRTNELQFIGAYEVCQNDTFDFDVAKGTITHKYDLKQERGEPYAYYAIAHFKDGGLPAFYVMGKNDIEKIRRLSQSTDKKTGQSTGPWRDFYDAMAKKTVLKQLCKYLPKSIEIIQKAVYNDETIKNQIEEDMTIVPDQTEYNNAEIIFNPVSESDETNKMKEEYENKINEVSEIKNWKAEEVRKEVEGHKFNLETNEGLESAIKFLESLLESTAD